MESLIAPFVNFSALVGILYWKLKGPVISAVAERSQTLRTELKNVQNQLLTAQAQYDEYAAKLKAIDAEIASLKEQGKQDAEAMRVKIGTEARRLATVIVADARISAQSLFADFKTQLRAELAHKVLDKSEVLIKQKLTGDDRVRIRSEFSRRLGSVAASNKGGMQ